MGDHAHDGRIAGLIVERGESGYEPLRAGTVWSGCVPDRFPEVIVRPESRQDVQTAVALARSRGLRIAVRSGGHSWCGAPLRSDGMLIDLSRLRGIVVNEESATATVQPAVTAGDLVRELTPRGLMFPVGHCPTVAVGGYLLGGGLGWNSGALGPACRSVREVEVVTATGEVLRCSETENPGLFWAARGAGPGFFGVVTAFRLGLCPLPAAVVSSRHVFPLDEVDRVAEWADALARAVAPNVEVTLTLRPAGDGAERRAGGSRVADLGGIVFAHSAEEAVAALEPLRACPFADRALTSEVDEPSSLPALYEGSEQAWAPGRRYAVDTLWSDAGLTDLVPALARALERAPSTGSLALVPVTPPAGSSRASADMAFSPLGTTYAVPYAIWKDPGGDEANTRWLRETMRALEPLTTGHYVAEADLMAGAERARRSYTPSAWQRLAELRAEHDPDQLFHAYPTP